MKVLIAALVVTALLAVTCDAKKGKGSAKTFDKSYKTAKTSEVEPLKYLSKDFSSNEDSSSEEVDAMTSFDDIDEDTEAVVSVLDLASKILGDDKVVNKGKETRQKLRKTGKTDSKDLKGLMKPSKQCHDMGEKVEEICSKVNFAMKERFLERLYLNKLKKSEKRAGWVECCGLESAEKRLDCFTDIKISRLDDLCNASKKSRRINKCCQVKDQARLNCFNKINKKDCRPSPVKPTRNPTQVTKPPTCRYEATNPTGLKGKRQMMKGKKRVAFRDSKKQQKVNRMCCKAGQYSRNDNSTLGTCDTCKQNYESWIDTIKGTTDACPDKFIWCCMNLQSKEVKKPTTTEPPPVKELPKKASAEFCCSAGRKRSNSAGGLGAKLECYRGQAEMERERPEYGTDCFANFFKCCMEPKSKITTTLTPPPVIKDEVPPKKIPTDWDPRYKGGKLPDGLRRSPSGHYYYVDFASPDVPDVKQQFKKPSNGL